MSDLAAVLRAFHEATQCEAAVWVQAKPGAPVTVEVAVPEGSGAPPEFARLPAGNTPERLGPAVPGGTERLAVCIPGPRRAWLAVGPCSIDDAQQRGYLKFLVPVVGQYLQSALEVEHAANELAERYEEINLLYTTSEILGRTVSLEEAARTILTEISETVGARRGSILVHDRVTDTLQVVAALGVAPEDVPPIAVDDECSVSARVFRTQHPLLVERSEMPCDAEALYRRGAMLSVPITWTAPDGGEPLGVVNLSDRRAGQPFTAGDQKLVAAIATQIGTAVQNARLVRSSLAQQQLIQELQLAHDLQMKLLPNPTAVAPEAEVEARVVPAESVGGDFYHLFRLGEERTGIMIGDVSSHGYRAALIMALTMSASAIHAQSTSEPDATINALMESLGDELSSTEMFITLFYGVIDRRKGTLRYANTGHPHAFIVTADGTTERLGALDPPLGMLTTAARAASRPWRSGEDVLLLFTDGISDARSRIGARLGEERVLSTVRDHRTERATAVVERVFDMLELYTGDTPRRDDLTLVVARS